MRRSGHIVRQVLDALRDHGGARGYHHGSGAGRGSEDPRAGRQAGLQGVLRLSLRAVHVDQSGDRARHPEREAGAEGRATWFRSIAAWCWTATTAMPPSPFPWARLTPEVRKLLEVTRSFPVSRHRGGAGRQYAWAMSARRCRNWWKPTASAWCGSSWATASAPGCTKIRRCPNYGTPGHGPKLARGHGPGDRADGQCRQAGRRGAGR